MFNRLINTTKIHSFFLFGARGTGKTTYIQNHFGQDDVLYIDLLDSEWLTQLEAYPNRLEGIVNHHAKSWVVIDEIQKVPALLDEVHRLIEKKRLQFILTGSSARKLKRNAANLLAGRAFVFKMFPLTHLELNDAFILDDILSYGSLPKIFDFPQPREKVLFLKAYAETYLKEEILVEQLIRKLPPFRRFLEIAAHQDTELVSYSNIARDILVDPKIVSNYYEILEETLLGIKLPPFSTSIRKRQKHAPKFYWFDTGVRRALAGTVDDPVKPQSYEYGSLFESFLVNEIHRLLTYSERSFQLSYLRVDEDQEIDLIVERTGLPVLLIEIKSTDRVNDGHVRSLKNLGPSFKNARWMLLSRDPIAKEIDGVSCLPWREGLQQILAPGTPEHYARS